MKTSQYVPELARGVPRSLGSRDCGAHQSQEGKGPERHTHSQSPPLGQWKPRRGKEETDQICVSESSAVAGGGRGRGQGWKQGDQIKNQVRQDKGMTWC